MQHDDEIRICENHKKQVPLLWTFKFNGYEYWCPYCGYKSGMFGAAKIVKIPSTDLLEQQKYWEEKAKDYLSDKTDKWTYENKK
jgi:hypothetical protein